MFYTLLAVQMVILALGILLPFQEKETKKMGEKKKSRLFTNNVSQSSVSEMNVSQ